MYDAFPKDELLRAARDAAIGSYDASAGETAMTKAVTSLLRLSGKLRALSTLYEGFITGGPPPKFNSRSEEFKYMYTLLQGLVVASTGCGTKYGETKTVLGVVLCPDGKPENSKKSLSVVRLKVRARISSAHAPQPAAL